MYMELRKASGGRQLAWTKDQIIAGVRSFTEKEGRFPKAHEFDSFEHLPSSRSIQRVYGGLRKLKADLGITDVYDSGEYRSNLCVAINKRGREDEDRVGRLLDQRFEEVFVHRERLVGEKLKQRLDYVVYYRGGKFGVDVFYADSLPNLATILGIKGKKYADFRQRLYFVQTNPLLNPADIKLLVERKDIPLRNNVCVVSEKDFENVIGQYPRLEAI